MNRNLVTAVAALVLALMTSPAWSASKDKTNGKESERVAAPTNEQDVVVKLAGRPRQAGLGGKQSILLSVIPAAGGGQIEIAILGNDAKKLDLDSGTSDMLKTAKVGDLFEARIGQVQGRWIVQSIELYSVKEGEAEPNVYVFDSSTTRKIGVREATVVEVTRFKKPFAFVIPLAKGSDGKMGPNEEITKAVDALRNGDLVEVQAIGGGAAATLKSIRAYEPPKRAKFVKIAKQKVDEQEYSAVELEDEGSTITLNIARKDATMLMGKLRAIKPGSFVLFKSATDDKGNAWLSDIKPAPNEPTKEEPKTDSKGASQDKTK